MICTIFYFEWLKYAVNVSLEYWMKDLKDNRDLKILQTWDVPERYVNTGCDFLFILGFI